MKSVDWPRLGCVRSLSRLLCRDGDLLISFGSLVSTSVVTSGLGFVYWWVAARGMSVAAMGAGSAAISAMMVISTMGMFGMGTLLISELPRAGNRRWSLVSTCMVLAMVVAGTAAVVYVSLAWTVLPRLRASVATPVSSGLFCLGCAMGSASLVLDDALIGLRAGPMQLLRNSWFAASKLALLCGAVAAMAMGAAWSGNTGSEVVLGTWLAGTLMSLAVLPRFLRAQGILGGSARPDPRLLRGLRRDAVDHNLLNLSLFLPRTMLPLVVTVVLSTKATATFYTAWMLLSFLTMVPSHLATTLFAVASDDQTALRSKVRVSLLLALALGTPVALGLAVAADPIMGLFGPDYAIAGAGVLAVLALTYPATVMRQLYIAVSRIRRTVRRATIYACACGVAEMAAAWQGSKRGQLVGLACWVAGVFVLEGIVVAPTVLRAAFQQPNRIGTQPVDARGNGRAIESRQMESDIDMERSAQF